MDTIKAPFPWFGGKSRVAPEVWAAFGKVDNYVEPFFGSGAVLLARPDVDGSETETVNDADHYLANFWRACAVAPDEVAHWADWPVNEVDIHARHQWLVNQAAFRAAMIADPDHYDPKVAGWWVHGLCSWIGSGYCDPRHFGGEPSRQLPHLGDDGMGVNRNLPHLGNDGRGYVYDLMRALSKRLRRVRVACGDWSRVVTDSVTWRHGMTGVLLDPPYSQGDTVYGNQDKSTSAAVREWAIASGANPKMRIALCGYEGEHDMPPTWRKHEWKARGGYSSQNADGDNENAARERVWFSPACIVPAPPKQITIFDVIGRR